MTEAEARARLERMVAATSYPQLDADDLDDLMSQARIPDADCRVPSDAGWTPTFDLRSVAATGWELKAGRAIAYDFAEDGQRFNRSQLHEQCMKQAGIFRVGGRASVPVESLVSDPVVQTRYRLWGDSSC